MRDLYKILRVSPSASLTEIKQSYRKLVFKLHPDRHDERESQKERDRKTQEFKEITEAYQILTDVNQKRQYDFENRTTDKSSHAHYNRKVYTARPPPDWKFVWNHQYHYDMHYGMGMQKEALREARKRAEKDGSFDYESPLGKGFSFDTERPDMNYNPYAKKSPQGPPKVTFDYEEAYINMDDPTKRKQTSRRDRVVEDLYSRRVERQTRHAENHRRQHENEHWRKMQQRYSSSTNTPECVIL